MITQEQISKVKELTDSGISLRKAAKDLGLNYSSLLYWYSTEQRIKHRERSKAYFKNLSKEKKKSIYNKRKPYINGYRKKRYHEDNQFRQRCIDQTIKSRKKHIKENTLKGGTN